jgi:cytochrome c2
MQKWIRLVGTVLLIALTFPTANNIKSSQAGGWAVLTLDAWPTQVVANQPMTLGFTLRQHGQTLLSGQSGSVVFEKLKKSGEKPLSFKVHSARLDGHYTATIALPTTGVWRWQFNIFGEHPMPELTVLPKNVAAKSAETDQGQLMTLGKNLFVAKGCALCHAHAAITQSGEFKFAYGADSAPDLTNRPLDSQYLRLWLRDPKAMKPNTLMPNLSLKESEVEALSAFLAPTALAACPVTAGRTIASNEKAPVRSSVGRGYVLTGIVRSSKGCAPIARAKIVFLLANPQGVYDNDHEATVYTAANGTYRFECNFPGNYVGSPAPHIHLQISAPGHKAIETEFLPKKGATRGTFDMTLAVE